MNEEEFISLSVWAKKIGITSRRARTLCAQNRVKGAVKHWGIWLVPSDTCAPELQKRGRRWGK